MTRFPVRDGEGVTRYLGMIGQDNTLERQLAAGLHRAQRVELIGQVAAGLAHDLNNLLTVLVMGVGELSARTDRTSEEQKVLKDMSDAGAQATRLASRLLSFGRSTPVTRAPVEPDAAIRALTPLLKALARGRIDLSVTLGAPGARVIADPTAIEQILLNLVANARDAIEGEGTISVRTAVYARGTSSAVRLTVTDSGSGMDAETRAHVFEPFYTTKQDGEGTGLGLFNTMLLVQQAGGTITVESEPGKGTTFTIELPVDRAVAG
jgi:signal transduction histidine kinase